MHAVLCLLQAANVHAILASGPSVERVRRTVNDALGLLEDLNENLATFDTKLMVMREDIAAIEVRDIPATPEDMIQWQEIAG